MDTIETKISKNGASPARTRDRKMKKRRLLWGVGIGVLLLAICWGIWQHNQKGDTGLSKLQTAKAIRTTIVETISASGSVTAQTGAQVKIGSQITGRIKRLYADVGSHVKAGQVIAELDLPDLQAQLAQSRANLQQAVTKLQQQETGVGMQQTQNRETIQAAVDAVQAAAAKRGSAVAAATMQPQQTNSQIRHSTAALNTARAQENQAIQSYNLQIATANAALRQAEANAKNAASSLAREQQLFKQGYVAASDLDTAHAQADVTVAQVASARQNVALTRAKADADLQTARQQVNQAQADLANSIANRGQDVMKQQDLYNADAALQQSQAQLASARAGLTQNQLKLQDVAQARDAVRQAEAQVKYQQAQVDKSFIRTPISGTVLQLASQQGETLAAGLSAPTLIIVADLSRLQVDAFVDETDIGKVKLGQSATITVDAYPDKTFSGKVTKVASGSTLQQSVVTYDVSIALHDAGQLLKPDMTASVSLAVGEHPDVVAVPNEAVKQDKSGSSVYVLPPDGKDPVLQPVQTGATDGTYTEITSGLNEGDTVVLAGWPPSGGPGGMQMTPFGMRPTGGGGRGGGGGGGRRGGF